MYKDIYEYAKAETTNYQTQPIQLTDQYDWDMYEHVTHCYEMRESRFWKGKNDDYSRPYKNIVLENQV